MRGYKSFWQKFPWLWAICSNWHQDSVVIKLRRADKNFLQKKVDFNQVHGVYLKFTSIFGSRRRTSGIRFVESPHPLFWAFMQMTIKQLVEAHINTHFDAVEYIIFVRYSGYMERRTKEDLLITIYSPPQGEKYFNQPTG